MQNTPVSIASKRAFHFLYFLRKASAGLLFLLAAPAFGQTYFFGAIASASDSSFRPQCTVSPIPGPITTPTANVSFSFSCGSGFAGSVTATIQFPATVTLNVPAPLTISETVTFSTLLNGPGGPNYGVGGTGGATGPNGGPCSNDGLAGMDSSPVQVSCTITFFSDFAGNRILVAIRAKDATGVNAGIAMTANYVAAPPPACPVTPTGNFRTATTTQTPGCIGHAPTRPSPQSDTNFFTDLGKSAQPVCQPRSQGPITFDIPITRYLATTNGAGMLGNIELLTQNSVVSDKARVLVAVYNAKLPNATGTAAEYDGVTLNGKTIGAIRGTANDWKVYEIDVPISQIRFPDQMGDRTQTPVPPPNPAHNLFRIDLDLLNSSDTYCVAVDWAQITFGAQAPLMLIHGTAAMPDTWLTTTPLYTNPVAYLQQNIGVDFEYQIALLPNGSFDQNALLLRDKLNTETTRRGVHSIHLVGHSKGASDIRDYLTNYYKPSVFKVLDLYSLGTPSQGSILSDFCVEADKWLKSTFYVDSNYSTDPIVAGLFSEFVDTAATNVYGNMTGLAPVDPARELQRVNMHDFNQSVHQPPGVPYYSLAGNADVNGDGVLDYGESRGMFPADISIVGPVSLPVAPRVIQFLANRAYQALGRVKYLNVLTQSGATWWNRKISIVQAIVSPKPEPNDMVSTISSVHCTTECGFQPLGNAAHPDAIYPYNHTTIKNGEIMQTIWDNIVARFPVTPF
jgi:hypothetical protein